MPEAANYFLVNHFLLDEATIVGEVKIRSTVQRCQDVQQHCIKVNINGITYYTTQSLP